MLVAVDETQWGQWELVKTCQEKKELKNSRNNNKPVNQGRGDVEDLHACLIAEGEPREECRRCKIEVQSSNKFNMVNAIAKNVSRGMVLENSRVAVCARLLNDVAQRFCCEGEKSCSR